MKNKLLLRISFSALIILFSGLLSQSKAQVVIVRKTEKKSNNLPPGQAKKIYGEKSAKRFAPGQRKKAYGSNWQYNKNRKHLNKKWEHDNKNKKHHGHED